ncbi:MAG: hypothetical protein N2V73_08185 [Candidatus Methanospirare jalkutatii]|nr:hypothetical protein [Candidatus Methanospirare jalkutatii]
MPRNAKRSRIESRNSGKRKSSKKKGSARGGKKYLRSIFLFLNTVFKYGYFKSMMDGEMWKGGDNLEERIVKLKELGVKIPRYFEKEYRKAWKKYPQRYYSILSTLDFVEEFAKHVGGENIEVESQGDRIDVKAEVDGKIIAFEVKSTYFDSKPSRQFLEALEDLNKEIKPGRFIKVTLARVGSALIPVVHEYKRVSDLEFSCGAIYCPVDNFLPEAVRRINRKLQESHRQLKSVKADYKIAVFDLRYEYINEWDAYYYTLLLLCNYKSLNGAILIKYDINKEAHEAGVWFIPVSNLTNPIDWKIILKKYALPSPNSGTKAFFALPAKIHFKTTGWQELIEIKPGYRIFYKDIYYGNL